MEAVPETKRLVVVDWVVVEKTPVKFCKVVEPSSCKLPLKSTRKMEVVALAPTLASSERRGRLEEVEVAMIDKRARGDVVPIPMLPVVELAEVRELKVKFPVVDQIAMVLAEPVPVRLDPPIHVLPTMKHPVATETPPLKVEVPAPVA